MSERPTSWGLDNYAGQICYCMLTAHLRIYLDHGAANDYLGTGRAATKRVVYRIEGTSRDSFHLEGFLSCMRVFCFSADKGDHHPVIPDGTHSVRLSRRPKALGMPSTEALNRDNETMAGCKEIIRVMCINKTQTE